MQQPPGEGSRIHQVLLNPIYYGEFYWLGAAL